MSALKGGELLVLDLVFIVETDCVCGFRCLIHNVDGDGESVGRQSKFLD